MGASVWVLARPPIHPQLKLGLKENSNGERAAIARTLEVFYWKDCLVRPRRLPFGAVTFVNATMLGDCGFLGSCATR